MLNLILVGGFWTTFLEAALVDSDYDLALLLPKGSIYMHIVYTVAPENYLGAT